MNKHEDKIPVKAKTLHSHLTEESYSVFQGSCKGINLFDRVVNIWAGPDGGRDA